MQINQLIDNFRCFLLSCWPQFLKLQCQINWDESPYFTDDWLQANWELMVEYQALKHEQYLAPYGYNHASDCRYLNKGKVCTHRVACKEINKEEVFYFLCLVTKSDDGCAIRPPFDFIDVEDKVTGKRTSIPLKNATFYIEPVQ